MINILFWVRKSAANKKGYAPLKIRLTMPGGDICDFATGRFVEINFWNPDRKIVVGKSAESERTNLYISRSEVKLKDIYDDLLKEGRDISSELVRNIFLGKAEVKMTLLGIIDMHNSAFDKKIKLEKNSDKKRATTETLGIFQNMRSKLEKFIKHKYNRNDVFLSEVNFDLIDSFRTWLLQYGHHKKGGLSRDTATGNLKKLHKITTYHFKRGDFKQDPFLDIPLSWEDPTAVGLSEDQLEKLEKLNLKIPRLQAVLDRFIVGCYSGMSHSDISKVTRDDLVKNFVDHNIWIRLRRTKTGEYCKIPVLPPVQAIIEKYSSDQDCIRDNKLFPIVGLNSCNEYLKQIAVFAELKGVNLTTHSARHTFAQMAMDLGVDIEAIAEILGHANSKTTKSTYARASHKFVSAQIENFKQKKFPQMKVVKEDKSAG